MRDEIDGRLWAEHHAAFSDSIGRALKAAGEAFRRLHDIQFSAPWRSSTDGARHA